MNKEILTDEERRRRRNEASRRCYLKRKAMLEGKAAPKAAKAKPAAKPAAKKVEAKPAKALRLGKAPDAQKLAEKAVKKFARVAAGVKPMLREAADALAAAYKSGDEKLAAKVERVLAKGLGVEIESPVPLDRAKSRVGVVAWSKALKTPAFRLPALDEGAVYVDFEKPAEEEAAEEPAEVPVDPDLIAKVEDGEADKADLVRDDKDEEDEGEDGAEDEDEDEDGLEDEDDDSEEAQERRRRRREREERALDDDWATGRQEMLREMDAQGVDFES